MYNRKTPVLSETVDKIQTIIENHPDAQLTSVRNLAQQCTVSPVTVLRAIAVLKSESLLEGG